MAEPSTADKAPEHEDEDDGSLRTPYGPQYGKVDEAAGGADSSPFDNMSSDERQAVLEKGRRNPPDACGPANG